MQKEIVGIYRNHHKHVKNVTLIKVLSSIKDGGFSKEIDNIRTLINQGKKEEANNLKKQLWAFTPCGTFGDSREAKNLQTYNRLVVLDYDGIPAEIYNKIFENVITEPTTYCAFKSPSGNGIKVLVKIGASIGQHKAAFVQVKEYYEKISGYLIDGSGKDVSRLCYVSYDEELYLNEDSQIFDIEVPVAQVDIASVAPNYIASSTISKQDIDRKFSMVRDFTNNKGQFFEGNRNNYVHLFSCNANRAGIPFEQTLSYALSVFGYDTKEVTSTVSSAYKNTFDFGIDSYRHSEASSTYGVANVSDVANVAQQTSTTKKFYTFQELAEKGKDLKPLKKIFGNFILEGSTTLFPSERGVGKSMLAMEIAIAISSGANQFLGEELEINGNVLYVNLELGENTLSRRLTELYKDVSHKSEFATTCITSNSGLSELKGAIQQYCKEYEPVLIIIDNLRTAFNGKDNEKNKEMTSIILDIKKLKEEANTSVLIIHHTKKGTGNQLTNSDMQSGAGALSDLVDADFFLRKSGRDKNLRLLKRVKARECEEQEGAKLIRLNPETLWFEHIEDGVDESSHIFYAPRQSTDSMKEKAFDLRDQGFSNSNIARELNVDRSTVGRWLK